MNVSPVGSSAALSQAVNTQTSQAATQQGPAQQQAATTSQSSANAGGSSPVPAATVQELVQAASVPPSIMQRALSDGDGRTGVAALNDGDAAASAAKLAAKMG